jgi:hypothetical protein
MNFIRGLEMDGRALLPWHIADIAYRSRLFSLTRIVRAAVPALIG